MGSHKDSLLLPKTTLPIKADLPANEPARHASWWEGKVYERMKRDGKDLFVLHDGPPYANGDIHIGHALNKILKDFVVKLEYFNGRSVEFRPGWDCHGLPIEQKAKQLHPDAREPFALRQKCREYAAAQVAGQKEQFKSLGVVADWEFPYTTMDAQFELLIYRRLCDLYANGLIEQRNKPVYWSWAEKTALSEAEIEYQDRTDTSVYVVFPTEYETFPGGFLVWTTTPWTLPANAAVALHPDIDYTAAQVNGYPNPVIIQESLFDVLVAKGIVVEKRGHKTFKGRDFAGWKVKHPINDSVVPIIMCNFVKGMQHGDWGTGCVHIAPGHGDDDYKAGLDNGLPMVMPVGPDGIYTEGKYAGRFVFDANKVIVEDLKTSGRLVMEEKITHSYPHCWRSGTPVIFRATPQVFLKLGNYTTAQAVLARRDGDEIPAKTLRDLVWAEIDNVVFFPENTKNRMKPMLTLRPDWCLSRQRAWGVPIAFFRDGGELVPGDAARTQGVLAREGIDAWSLPEKGAEYFGGDPAWEKIPDILDVWFDSGLSWDTLGRQADVYLEGNDQHRGWFQSSLWLGVALTGKSPYKKAITHGFVVDGDGHKMSKQKGNVVNPNDVVKKYGAEVIRYWVATTDYTKEVALNDEILKRAAEGHKKLRNTFRFFLANLGDENPGAVDQYYPIDRWVIDTAFGVFAEVHGHFGRHEFHKGMRALTEFVNGDLNGIYFNAVKDRLYCDEKGGYSRTSCRSALVLVLDNFLSLVAPLFTYTVDEVLSHSPEWFREGRDVFDLKYSLPPTPPSYECVNYLNGPYWKAALEKFHGEFDKLKTAGLVKDTLEVTIEQKDSAWQFFPKAEDWFVVSFVTGWSRQMQADAEVLAEFEVQGDVYRIVKSTKGKCERCWKRNATGDLCPRCEKAVALQPRDIVVESEKK